MKLRVEVDGEPLAPGAAVSGRVVVEDGGRARSLSVTLAFVERTEDFHKVARDAGAQVVAEGDLADGAIFPFLLRLPDDDAPHIATPPRADRMGGPRPRRSRRAGPDCPPSSRTAPGLHCPGPGEVAEWLKALAC